MAAGDLTTLAAVRAYLSTGQSPFPITDDALLAGLIAAASQYIQTWLNRQIASQDYIEVRDGSGGHTMMFGAFPVTAVTSLAIDGVAVPAIPPVNPATPQVLTVGFFGGPAGYTFSPTVLGVRGYFFRRGIQNVQMQYTAGYAAVPPDLAQACIELVALRYRERTRTGEVSKHLGGAETVTYSQKDMAASTMTLIRQYRLQSPITGFLTPIQGQFDLATLVGAA